MVSTLPLHTFCIVSVSGGRRYIYTYWICVRYVTCDYRWVCVSALVTYSVVLCTSEFCAYSDPPFSVMFQCISLYKIFDLIVKCRCVCQDRPLIWIFVVTPTIVITEQPLPALVVTSLGGLKDFSCVS